MVSNQSPSIVCYQIVTHMRAIRDEDRSLHFESHDNDCGTAGYYWTPTPCGTR